MTIRSLRHAGIVVREAERALRFYRDLLELEVVSDQLESGPFIDTILARPGTRVRTVKLRAAEGLGLVELLEFDGRDGRDEPPGLTDLGPTHAALTVEGIDGLAERLTQAGVEFLSTPEDSPDGRARVAFCRDPDGTLLELVEPLA